MVASRIGALTELVGEEGLVPAGDAGALAQAARTLWDDGAAGARARERVAAIAAPAVVAEKLQHVYSGGAGAL